MKLLQKKTIFLLILALCIAFSVVYTEIHAAKCLHHDCRLANCPTCLQIEIAKNFLKILKTAMLVLLISGCLLFSAGISQIHSSFTINTLSPVNLKVRFNS